MTLHASLPPRESPPRRDSPALPGSPLPPWGQWALIGLAALALLLPAADLAHPYDPSPPPLENRKLADLPAWQWTQEALRTYPARFEAWNQDHFGLRSTLIHWHSVVMLDWLGVSPNPDVLIGTNGWLFMGRNKAVDAYRCVFPATVAELDAEVKTVRERRDWLAARGIRYLNVWAPVKKNVYPEYLPGWVQKTGGPCRLDQWMARMNKERLPVLDLRPALQAAKREGLAYHVTDTHWNSRGAYFSYRALVERLQPWFPRLRPLSPERVRFFLADRLGGDLARQLDLHERYHGPEVLAEFVGHRCGPAELHGLERPAGVKLEAYECPKDAGQRNKPPRLVLLGDSYQNALIPFLAETMGRTLTAEFAGFDKELILQEKPDVVVEIHVERQLQPDR